MNATFKLRLLAAYLLFSLTISTAVDAIPMPPSSLPPARIPPSNTVATTSNRLPVKSPPLNNNPVLLSLHGDETKTSDTDDIDEEEEEEEEEKHETRTRPRTSNRVAKNMAPGLTEKLATPVANTMFITATSVGVNSGVRSLAEKAALSSTSLAGKTLIPVLTGAITTAATILIKDGGQNLVDMYKRYKKKKKKAKKPIGMNSREQSNTTPIEQEVEVEHNAVDNDKPVIDKKGGGNVWIKQA
ncbi:hypothetical protein BDF22DRAFT_679000, partial [Syncephalis plumigaleata]